MKRKLHLLVAVLGIALLGGGAWWWQNRDVKPAAVVADGAAVPREGRGPAAGGGGRGGGGGPQGPATVEVGNVESLRLVDDVQAVGSLKSAQSVVLRPEVAGRIAKFGFVNGQQVRRGQLLVQLDDTLQQAQLRQAEAQSSIARTNLQRSRELLAQNFISASAVDQNGAALEVAEAQVALARAQLARMKILAPFDGTAGIRRADVGDYLKDGADIVNIEDLSSLSVDFSLPERYLARVRQGLPVEVALDALPGRSFRGRVEAMDALIDANGRALLVRARVDNPGALLKPGMFARPRLVFGERANALVVPEEALVPMNGRQYIFKVTAGPDAQVMAQRIEARLGMRLPGKVELLDGVAAGDRIVTAGQARLARGERQPVRVIELGKPAGRPGSAALPAASAGAA